MKIKSILKTVLAGASMAVLFGFVPVGTASAANVDLDIYGASAQYLYWNASAPNILTNMGCTNIQQATFNKKNAITQATCGADTIHYRVSAKASFDGPLALLGDDHFASVGATKEKCSAGDPGDPGVALRPFYRKMVDEASCTWGTPSAPGTCTALKCVPITLGASDVAAESFTQSSTGQSKGPLGGGLISRSFAGIDASTLNSYNPVVVPFAFFANTTVQRDLNYANTNGLGSNFQTITNIPRIMAVMIFSGQAFSWKDFGDDFVNLPVVACLRHAGSGTHATLDNAVMHGAWGGGLSTSESAFDPTVWFNGGSSDERRCVAGSGAWTGTGAIGYADADQATTATMVRLKYNGEDASRINLRNGRYSFFTKQWMYENPTAPAFAQTHPFVTAMMTFAADPNSIPTGTSAAVWGGNDKSAFWATNAEMVYMKSSDLLYPGFVGALSPQLP